MDLPGAIKAVTELKNLDGDEMRQVMHTIMTGEATPAQIGWSTYEGRDGRRNRRSCRGNARVSVQG